ncbi:ATP-binding cassette domain-containing protein [uncultured Chitinophaga sp.]|jgi:ABC-type sulfate/molybdate transport systems, ATPase component|uniref:ABC transporter ATP-binding protein n=1 Tax=uncultured Chitinophaga sp. TaxID=339340 RepID=UPI00262C8439|nr:ATP-binding cassette domain-containing protein [uncultured Chitinophaga sp.]
MINFALQKTLSSADGPLQLDVQARFEKGQFISLYGVSGAGKTSLLRMLAGLMKPDSGVITVNGTVWYDAAGKIDLAPQHRQIGFVFQDYALFPNMNVRENIAYGLRKRDPQHMVDELLELTGLSRLAAAKVHALSGGQQQRVALARAIARQPSVLLLDEPLSAVDNAMRMQLQDTLAEIHQRFALTTILVSHNENEIVRLSDVVIELEQGRFQRQAKPADFFVKKDEGAVLTGRVVAVEDNGELVILLDNRMLRVAGGEGLKVDDRIALERHGGVPSVRKLL